jgi:2'-5' RNA ligase
MTLARSDGVRAGPETLRRLVAEAEHLDVAWRADELVLFESVTGGGPARYESLLTVPLTGGE